MQRGVFCVLYHRLQNKTPGIPISRFCESRHRFGFVLCSKTGVLLSKPKLAKIMQKQPN